MGLAGQRVLVTGAAGFIGSHLTERLVSLGAATRVLIRYTSTASCGWLDDSPCRTDLEVFQADLCDAEVLLRAMRGVDVVFHLAALIGIPYSYEAPFSYVRTNVEGTVAVLQAARSAGVTRVVHTSTSEVYGTAVSVPMPEAHVLQPQSPYAASKAAADVFALSFHRSFGLPVTVVRPFNTYGPRQSTRAVIPTIITQALSGREICLGRTAPTRDFTYVSDTVEGFIEAATRAGAPGQVFNVGSGREISIAQLAELIQSVTGTSKPVTHDPVRDRPTTSEVDRLCADTTRARTVLGWEPRIDLRNGLSQTAEWLERHLPARADTYRV